MLITFWFIMFIMFTNPAGRTVSNGCNLLIQRHFLPDRAWPAPTPARQACSFTVWLTTFTSFIPGRQGEFAGSCLLTGWF